VTGGFGSLMSIAVMKSAVHASWLALLVAAFSAPRTIAAQSGPDSTAEVTVGLALSGGSAKGLAHIGVLRVLEERGVPVHVVTGTSMGAIVGGLHAIGFSPQRLEDVALEVDWDGLFGNLGGPPEPPSFDNSRGQHIITLPLTRSGPRLPSNLISGQAIFQLLARLTWPAHDVRDFRLLATPFAAVAVDFETGEAVRLDSGFLPQAIQASMALPSIFEPVKIGDRVFIDGGVTRNLPAQDAIDLGASVVICSDVSEPLLPADSIATALKAVSQAISFAGNRSNEEQRVLCDVVLRMQFERGAGMEFNRAAEWIALGDSVARANIAAIRAAVRGSRPAVARQFSETPDSIAVRTVRVTSNDDRLKQKTVLASLKIDTPGWATAEMLDTALDRAYRGGRYRLIRYRPDSVPDRDETGPATTGERVLTVYAERVDPAKFGFGFRYEGRYKASLLMSGIFHGVGNATSDVRIDLRLGQQFRFAGDYLHRSKPGLALAAGGGIDVNRTPFDVFEEGQAVAELDFRTAAANGVAGFALGSRLVAALRVHGEYSRWRTAIAPEAGDTSVTFYTIGGAIRGNWYGTGYFPRSGAALLVKSEFASSTIGGGLTFSHHIVDAGAHIPVHSRVSILTRATAGAAFGDELPLNYVFTLGGASQYYILPDRQFQFFGLEMQELAGRAIQRFSLGLQTEPITNVFASVQWNTGTTYDEWDFDIEQYINGYAVTFGAETLLGAIALTLSERTFKEAPNVRIDFGSRF